VAEINGRNGNGAVANWIQFGILLLAILAAAVHAESRMARMEQGWNDLVQRVTVIEQRIDAKFDGQR
jgi:hypothetical protein